MRRITSLCLLVLTSLFAAITQAGVSASPTTSTNGSYTVSWSGSSSGKYTISEAINGGARTTLHYGMTGTSRSFSGRANGTYTYYVMDPESFYVDGVGWISQDLGSVTVTVSKPVARVNSVSWNKTSIKAGESAILTWSSSNASSCKIDGVNVPLSDSKSFTFNSAGSFSKTVTCYAAGGNASKSANISVTAQPVAVVNTVNWNTNPITAQNSATLTWSSSNATSCTIDGANVPVSGNKAFYFASAGSYTKTVTCYAAGGNSSRTSPALTVNPLPVAVVNSVTWNKNPIHTGQSATLSWSSSNATSCTVDGFSMGPNDSKSFSFNNVGNFTKTVICYGAGGNGSRSSSPLSVTHPPAGLSASLESPAGTNSNYTDVPFNLTWSSTNTSSCSYTGGPNNLPVSGNVQLYGKNFNWQFESAATNSWMYDLTLTCRGLDGKNVSRLFQLIKPIKGAPPAPSVTAEWSKSSATVGEQVLFTWGSTQADSCTLNGNPADLADEVPHTFTSEGVKQWAVTCTNPNGSTTKSASITINLAAPGTPSSISAPATAETGSYQVSWGSASGVVTRYELQESKNGGSYGPVSLPDPLVQAMPFDKAAGNSYDYRVRACNGTANCGPFTSAVKVTIPAASLSVSVSSSELAWTGEPVSLSWQSTATTGCSWQSGSLSGSGSSIQQGLDITTTTGWTLETFTSLYTKSVPVTCTVIGGGTITRSANLTAQSPTQPLPPTVSANWSKPSALVNEQVSFTWNAVGADSCSLNSTPVSHIEGTEPASFSSAGMQTWTVTCSNAYGTRNVSDSISIAAEAPGVPSNFTLTPVAGTQNINVSWAAPTSGGAPDRYTLFKVETELENPVKYDGDANNFSTVIAQEWDTTASYYLSACNETDCTSTAAETVSVVAPPVTVSASVSYPDGVDTDYTKVPFTLSWQVTNAISCTYTDYNGDPQALAEGGDVQLHGENYSWDGPYYEPVTHYQLTMNVTCQGVDGKDKTSSIPLTALYDTYPPEPLDAPVMHEISRDAFGEYIVSWSAVDGSPIEYALFEDDNGAGFKPYSTGATLQQSLGNSKPVGIYEYQVKACYVNNDICSGPSQIVRLTITDDGDSVPDPSGPYLTVAAYPETVSTIQDSITLDWKSNAMSSCSWNTGSEGGSIGLEGELPQASDQDWQLHDAEHDVYKKNYTVTCELVEGGSLNKSATVYADPRLGSDFAPGVPVNFTVPSNSITGFYDITWEEPDSGAESYILEETANGEDVSELPVIGSTTHPVENKSNGDYFDYRVKACNGDICSKYTEPKRIFIGELAAPTNLQGPSDVNNEAINLTWDASISEGITHYLVEQAKNTNSAEAWGHYQSVSIESYELEQGVEFNLAESGTYFHRVRACVEEFCSAPSNEIETSVVESGIVAESMTPGEKPLVDTSVSDRIGSTAGQFRVDESGAATYSIAIATPAGIAGVTPQVSLNYSSQSGNGIAGLGWSLSATGSISRCRQTLGQDNLPKALAWNTEDRFCLNGQRLLLQEGPSYGSIGAIYKTETDSFVKVISHGGTPGNPDYFTVEAKDGSTSFYGNDFVNNLSKQVPLGAPAVLTWMQSRFQDSVGNAIDFVYHNDSAGVRLNFIDYAAGAARIVFSYDNRNDITSGYVGGYAFENSKRLSAIAVFNNVNNSGLSELRHYKLNYLPQSNNDLLSRLGAIEECSDGSNEVCLPPTSFSWQQPNYTTGAYSGEYTFSSGDKHGLLGYKRADINGDGLLDVVWLRWRATQDDTDHGLKYLISDGTTLTEGRFTNGSTGIKFNEKVATYGEKVKFEIIDYNLDGRHDVMVYSGGSGRWQVFLSEPQGDGTWRLSHNGINTGITRDSGDPSDEMIDLRVMDINSDGLADVVYFKKGRLYVRLLQQDPTQEISSNHYYAFGPEQDLGVSLTYQGDEHISDLRPIGDVNGDGIVDLSLYTFHVYGDEGIFFNIYSSYLFTLHMDSQQSMSLQLLDYREYVDVGGVREDVGQTFTPSAGSVMASVQAVDLNGDGFSDITYRKKGYAGYFYKISTGNSFGEEFLLHGSGLAVDPLADPADLELYSNLQFVDYNLDGYSDAVMNRVVDGSPAESKMYLKTWNQQTQSFNDAEVIRDVSDDSRDSFIFMDINGDGLSDYVSFIDKTVTTFLGQSGSGSYNRIEKITNGLGAETDIRYGSLVTSGHYDRLKFDTDTILSGSVQLPWSEDAFTYEFSEAHVAEFYSILNGGWDLPEGSHSLGKYKPTLELMTPMYVVTGVSSSAPAANENSAGYVDAAAKSIISYYYAEAKMQASGRGMLGFQRISTIDEQTNIATTTTYRQDFPFIGYPVKTEVRTNRGKGILLSEATNIWKLNGWVDSWPELAKTQGSQVLGAFQPYIAKSTEESFDLTSGDSLTTVVTENTYDNYGNATWIKATTTSGDDTFITETTNTYGISDFDLEKGRLSRAVVTKTRNGDVSAPRTSAFTYYETEPLKGLLHTEVIEPDQSKFKITTTYEYDNYGNKIKATQSGKGVTSRETSTSYENGRYLLSSTNAFGQVTETVVARNKYGSPTQVRDIAGNIADTTYGVMGTKVMDYSASGAWSTTLLEYAGAHCPSVARFQSVTTAAGGGISIACSDVLGRNVRSAKQLLDGTWSYVDTEFDKLGRVKRKSEPHTGTALYWTEMHYDILGRVVYTKLPDDSFATITYNGFTTTTTNQLLQSRSETKNALGELVKVEDNAQGILTYDYDTQGNLLSATRTADGKTATTEMTYDTMGRKESMDDPDKGTWTYKYNAFGELTSQTDAKGQTSNISYDLLGRMVSRMDLREDNSPEGISQWHYNNSLAVDVNGVPAGALQYVEDVVSGYRKTPRYDSLGRVSETVTRLASNDEHIEKITYDQYGRTHQTMDASNAEGSKGKWFHGIENRYNSYGYLAKVIDAKTSGEASEYAYYTVDAVDERGNVTQYTNGNNVVTTRNYYADTGLLKNIYTDTYAGLIQVQNHTYNWDEVGNLKKRYDYSGDKSLEESFEYDNLNRLKSAQVTGLAAQTIEYDGLGNITCKSDVGDYFYTDATSPYKLTGTSAGDSFQYDNNGNITHDGERSFIYSTYDKAIEISKGGHTTRFKYDTSRKRYERIDIYDGGSSTKTTHYIGSVEKITYSSGKQEIKRQLPGGALITLRKDSAAKPQVEEITYLHKDHLGSVDVITDSLGDVVQDMSFDAWGQRRDAAVWSGMSLSELLNFDNSITTRGFTGHEMLDEVGIIHMNGRIYDARLGRFMQADPFIDGVKNSQGYNRYAYVQNNPLNAVDPSGYWRAATKKVVFAVMAIVVTVACYGVCAEAALAGYLAAISAIQAHSVGGNVAHAAFSAFITSYAGGVLGEAGKLTSAEGILTVAAIGGMTSALQGGKFGHGFVSAGVGAMVGGSKWFKDAGPIIRAGVKAIIGGTMTKMTGGKFANGARMAALMSLLSSGVSSLGNRHKVKHKTPEFKHIKLPLAEVKIQPISAANEAGLVGPDMQATPVEVSYINSRYLEPMISHETFVEGIISDNTRMDYSEHSIFSSGPSMSDGLIEMGSIYAAETDRAMAVVSDINTASGVVGLACIPCRPVTEPVGWVTAGMSAMHQESFAPLAGQFVGVGVNRAGEAMRVPDPLTDRYSEAASFLTDQAVSQ